MVDVFFLFSTIQMQMVSAIFQILGSINDSPKELKYG